MQMRMYDIIEKKRDGMAISYEEINYFIHNYCQGAIPDYQAAALLMAIFLKGMNDQETADLTNSMASSGDRIDLSNIPGIKVDKHSTGGVGDKTTLVVGPIVASCGVPVAKMSGRGLGHTGGTIDKLEAILGFQTELSIHQFIHNVNSIGISIAGQTGNLAPADKKLYALRDVTATVNHISLIASSIMSKKLASGADAIVLDVKTGSGAFMKTIEESIKLAKAMVNIAEHAGKKATAIISDMDIPLGYAIGNSLEVIEAMETLKGNGPKDLEEVSVALASHMLHLAGKGSMDVCRQEAQEAILSGRALQKLKELIQIQHGEPQCVEEYSKFPKAIEKYTLTSTENGYIEKLMTDSLGKAAMVLGAGRETKESGIDFSAGIELLKKNGDEVKRGDSIAVLYTNQKDTLLQAEQIIRSAIRISSVPPTKRPLILATVEKDKVEIMKNEE